LSLPQERINMTTLYSAAASAVSGILDYWRLNEASSTTVADSGPSNHSGTSLLAITTAAGLLTDLGDTDTSIVFNGSQSISTALVPPANNFTFTAWFETTNLNQKGAIGGTFNFSGGNQVGWMLCMGSGGGFGTGGHLDFYYGLNTGATNSIGITSGNLTSGVTYFVVMTVSSGNVWTVNLYAAGVLVATGTFTAAVSVGTSPLMIGNTPVSGGNFAGNIQAATLSTGVMSSNEQLFLASLGTGLFQYPGVPNILSLTTAAGLDTIVASNAGQGTLTPYVATLDISTNFGTTWNTSTGLTGTYNASIGITGGYQCSGLTTAQAGGRTSYRLRNIDPNGNASAASNVNWSATPSAAYPNAGASYSVPLPADFGSAYGGMPQNFSVRLTEPDNGAALSGPSTPSIIEQTPGQGDYVAFVPVYRGWGPTKIDIVGSGVAAGTTPFSYLIYPAWAGTAAGGIVQTGQGVFAN
jgi:hypothetical protein